MLPSFECGRIGVEVAEVITPFLVFPHLRDALPVIEPGEIEFDRQGKITDFAAKNIKLTDENIFL